MSGTESCENTKLLGYDPTGESAVLCNEPGEYCSKCEMVLCASCHAQIATHPMEIRKRPVAVKLEPTRKIRTS